MLIPKSKKASISVDINRFRDAFFRFQAETNLSSEQIFGLLEKDEKSVPVSIFKNRKLGILEHIVVYLRDACSLSLGDIAHILNRDNRTIWSSYNQAKKKAYNLEFETSAIMIPVSIFTDRNLGILEAIVKYLRETFEMRYSEIGVLLNRDGRTIWTAYNRCKNK